MQIYTNNYMYITMIYWLDWKCDSWCLVCKFVMSAIILVLPLVTAKIWKTHYINRIHNHSLIQWLQYWCINICTYCIPINNKLFLLFSSDQFILTSKRHIGMPFGLSLYIDGIIDTRLSACCEYKYQAGKLLGGKSAHFKLMKVEGGKPCFQCELDNERKMRADGKYRRKRSEKEVRPLVNNVGILNSWWFVE